MTNSIRPDASASLQCNVEAQTLRGKSVELMGNVTKRRQRASGGWRRNDRKGAYMKQGDLLGERAGVHAVEAEEPGQAGVRASVVAEKNL